MKNFYTVSLAMMFAALAAVPTSAQNLYPVKQVRVVVPFPPGGSTDVLARDFAQQLSQRIGANTIVENRAGASGIVGTSFVAKAAADGGTLLFMVTHHLINPSLYKNLPYDPRKDFTNIGLYATMPIVLVAGRSMPAKTIQELLDLAKKEPGKLFFASGAIGGANHLSGELFNFMTGVRMQHVAYKGTAPAVTDLLGGQVPLMYDVVGTVMPYIRSGDLRPLAVTSRQRVPSLPDVPTIDETVAKGFETMAVFAVYGPAGLSPSTRATLEKAFMEIQATPQTARALAKFDALPGMLAGEPFTRFVDAELTKWNEVVVRAGVKVD